MRECLASRCKMVRRVTADLKVSRIHRSRSGNHRRGIGDSQHERHREESQTVRSDDQDRRHDRRHRRYRQLHCPRTAAPAMAAVHSFAT